MLGVIQDNSYSSGDVTATAGAAQIGGAGGNGGNSAGTFVGAGAVGGAGGTGGAGAIAYAAGIVGNNTNVIVDSHASGAILATASSGQMVVRLDLVVVMHQEELRVQVPLG